MKTRMQVRRLTKLLQKRVLWDRQRSKAKDDFREMMMQRIFTEMHAEETNFQGMLQ